MSKKKRVRRTINGGVIDEAFKSKLKNMWIRGYAIKHITYELGCAKSTVNRVRKELGLASRIAPEERINIIRAGRRYSNKLLAISVPPDLVERMDRHVFKFRLHSRSAFLCSLIKRELGE